MLLPAWLRRQGGFGFIGNGIATFIGSYTYESVALADVFGVGEFFAQGSKY